MLTPLQLDQLDQLDRLDRLESSLTSFFAGRASVFDKFTRKASARFDDFDICLILFFFNVFWGTKTPRRERSQRRS